jgi:hypothetical protein
MVGLRLPKYLLQCASRVFIVINDSGQQLNLLSVANAESILVKDRCVTRLLPFCFLALMFFGVSV